MQILTGCSSFMILSHCPMGTARSTPPDRTLSVVGTRPGCKGSNRMCSGTDGRLQSQGIGIAFGDFKSSMASYRKTLDAGTRRFDGAECFRLKFAYLSATRAIGSALRETLQLRHLQASTTVSHNDRCAFGECSRTQRSS